MNPTPRKLEIIAIASALFKDKGYSAVTMRDIAKAMGIKAASLYNHIKNKEEILTFIIISLAPLLPSGSFFTTYGAALFWFNFSLILPKNT